MKVFCVHYLFIRNGRLVEMPPRTVENLEEAGVVITLNGKPESTQIQMNYGNAVEFENTGTMATKKESMNPHISTMRIDDFVDSSSVIPDFIKIDVEGFEYEVLEGMTETLQKFQPKIIMETHSSELRRKCHRFLTDVGYEQWYEGRSVIGKDWMDEVTNLFYGAMTIQREELK